jgi:AraC-like DNA-binding protein
MRSSTSETRPGVLYTDHRNLRGTAPVASLWSYDGCKGGKVHPPVTRNADGSHEYWLERFDPLLNTILPGTGVSVVVNCGDNWVAGRSLVTSEIVPRVCVVGPVTQPRILRVGLRVQAIGVGLLPTHTTALFGVPASALIDRLVPLEDLWPREDVERLLESFNGLDLRRRLSLLRDELVARIGSTERSVTIGDATVGLIEAQGGRVSVDKIAKRHGISRQMFARRFRDAAGLSPKLFARITRFQALVPVLLSTDVSQWAAEATAVGFYDQAHMINEFRAFTGSSPTTFFQPHGLDVDNVSVHVKGRPSEWVRHKVSGISSDR